MKRILQRGKHLWKAKGRHGTHSPFVYAFLEQVMRSKKKFRTNTLPAALTAKQIDLIGRTIQYLDPDKIYADAVLFEIIKEIAPARNVLRLNTSEQHYGPGACFVGMPRMETINFLKGIAAIQACAAIVPLYPAPEATSNWKSLQETPAFKMVLDAWYIGFVSSHPDFKVKQYFRLR